MTSIRQQVPPGALQVFDRLSAQSQAEQGRGPSDPAVQQATARVIEHWAQHLTAGPSLHLTAAMLEAIPDAELKAEVVLAVFARQMRQANLGIKPSAERSPFTAPTMGQALKRLGELSLDDVCDGLSAPENGDGAFEKLVRLVAELGQNLGLPNEHQAGVTLGMPEKHSTYVGRHYAKGGDTRLVMLGAEHYASGGDALRVVEGANGWYIEGGSPDRATMLTSLSMSTLAAMRARVLEAIGDADAKPVHPGLAQLGEELAGKYPVLQALVAGIDGVVTERNRQIKERERLLTSNLAAALRSVRSDGAAPVGEVDITSLRKLVAALDSAVAAA